MNEETTTYYENGTLVFEDMLISINDICGITRGERDEAVIWVRGSEEPYGPGVAFEIVKEMYLAHAHGETEIKQAVEALTS